MRNRTALFFATLLISLMACVGSNDNTKGISGTVKGAAGESVYFMRYQGGQLVASDTAIIAEDGSFKLTPKQPLQLDYYQVRIGDDMKFLVVTDSTENVVITADAADFDNTLSFSGSKESALLDQFEDDLRPIAAKLDELRKLTKDPNASDIEKQQAFSEVVDLNKKKTELALSFVSQNTGSAAVLPALAQLNMNQHMTVFKNATEQLKDKLKDSYYFNVVRQQVAAAQKAQQNPASRKNGKYSVGMEAPDIQMEDPEGNKRSLHDLRGKVVMIDFWASWCGPCRRENPNVVAAYQRYNKDGFEIFSVSLDKDKTKWVRAIQQDGLLWPNHVSDLQGWNNAASRDYGVSSIPHTILVGRDGKIIATHLRGAALEAKLAELFEEA